MMKKYLLALLIVPSLVCAMEIVKNVSYSEPTNTIIAWCETTGSQYSVVTTVSKNCDSGEFTSDGVRIYSEGRGAGDEIDETEIEEGIVRMLKKMIAEFELE